MVYMSVSNLPIRNITAPKRLLLVFMMIFLELYMKSNVLSCSYWTWVLHSIPLIMICYCQCCGNTSAYVILPSIGFDQICPSDNSLYWLMVWYLKRFLCRVEYHKDRFWVLVFLQFTSFLLVTSLENMVSNSTCMLMTVSCILHLACQQMRQYPACRWPLMIFVHGVQQIC